VEHAGTEDLNAYFRMDDYGNIRPEEPEGYTPHDFSGYHDCLPEGTVIDPLGVARRPGSMYHFIERISPLRNATRIEELESYPFETYANWRTDHMAEEVAERHGQGLIASAAVNGIYEAGWQIRGYEPFLMDMATRPEWCETLMDKALERNLKVARAAAQAGVDVFRCGENIANQNGMTFGIERWRRLIKPRWAKVWALCREIKPDMLIYYHADGNIESIIDELIEIGVTLLNPIQPECLDVAGIAERYKDKILFDGGIGIQQVMPFGAPEDVRASVRERVGQFGRTLFLAPSHTLEPEVPIENVEAFFEACDEVGADSLFSGGGAAGKGV